jgi:PBP1b-binding outer membrane lipoprotein LpoB
MKTLIASLFTISILFTGCATVTDANVDLADEPTEETTTMERAGDT